MELAFLSSRFIRDHVSPRPVIDDALCSVCGQCVQVCPAQPKAIAITDGKKQPPVYAYEHCIRCYCCQELCPQGAIRVVTPLLGRLIHR